MLTDDRFKSLFKDPDFEVDKESEHFQQISDRLRKYRETQGGDALSDEDEEVFPFF